MFVCWDTELIPARDRIRPPPLYIAAAECPNHTIGEKEMVSYFASFSSALAMDIRCCQLQNEWLIHLLQE